MLDSLFRLKIFLIVYDIRTVDYHVVFHSTKQTDGDIRLIYVVEI